MIVRCYSSQLEPHGNRHPLPGFLHKYVRGADITRRVRRASCTQTKEGRAGGREGNDRRERFDGSMTADPSSSSSTAGAPSVKGVARTLSQHHRAVVGFLFGFFVILVLYTTASGQFGTTNTIVALRSTPAEQNARTSPPPPASTPTSSAPNNISTQGKKDEAAKTTGEVRIRDKNVAPGTDMNNKTADSVQANRTGQSGQTVNDASDRMEEELIRQELGQDGDKNESNVKQLGAPPKPVCDLSDPRYDICEISGDARAIGGNRTVLYVPPAGERRADGQEWAIKDQSRKYLEYIDKVTVKTLSAAQSLVAPECTSRHAVPAVVFAMNGLTSNPWHDFSDVIVPLFITARAYDGEVQFLVTDLQPWFVDKYRLILANLSRYDIVDFNKDAGVRCHPRIVVGLRSHRDLGIDPARTPRNYTLLDFRMYIRDIFSLPPDGLGIPYKQKQEANRNATAGTEKRKPRLMLINRGRNRKFVNIPEISAAVEAAGFEVVVVEPRRDLRLEEFSKAVDSCDVLMGAHGAGLTNFFFLRTNATMLQVVPWGHMEHSAMIFYGVQAKEMRLRDVEYSITAEESTLYDKYGKDHPAVSDPESIHKQGWQLGMKYYWLEQDIRLNVTRFAPTLHRVLRTAEE
ncbi:beta-1,2-xylosyltransferase XYXT1-like isoform X2 [Hordeum vulgare subsp. vulgare]|uniref:beta-1,2-xylosyltransferase XYXT1-like isoform X2 n=1 Tax=Hordeum vulgare subsp. vulgare TaxID=112509 RepID=UPI000294FAE6|nr:beta-1,2-xylosyltransferase XYXT1-like isoform X2 [Hordeum vulgare subsp. vulgare]